MLNMVGLNSIKQYSYFADFYNDENVKKEVKQINDKLGLTLFEIEKVIEKMDGFLRKRQFMLNGDDKIKCIKVKHTSSLLNNALIMLFYSLVALQITNIKLFNKILYDEIYFEERTFNEVTNWKEDGIEKISLIVFKNPQIQDMMKSNDCLETIYNKFVISENGNIISIYDNTLFNEENGMIINESNIGIIKNIYRPISKDKFHISFLYSYDDYKVMGKDISKMFSFTFKEYLRFQISQM